MRVAPIRNIMQAPSPSTTSTMYSLPAWESCHDVDSKVPTLKVQGTVHMLNIDCVHSKRALKFYLHIIQVISQAALSMTMYMHVQGLDYDT